MGNENDEIVYLDYNATTPIHTKVIQSISESLKDHWGNPSSTHQLGKDAKTAILQARTKIANAIGCKQELDIIITSGGTEVINETLRENFQPKANLLISPTTW